MKPRVVAIIGSSKPKEQHLGVAQKLALQGKIGITRGFYHHVDRVPITEDQRRRLDELCLARIDLADEVFVVNVNGYIGASTTAAISHAQDLGKPIAYLEEPVPFNALTPAAFYEDTD